MGKSSKGSKFERQVCKELSLWWTSGTRDDIFWRSSQSGGRATTRRKKGKSTAGQYGDVAATDPLGVPLLELFTIELKRGYQQHTFHDLFDSPATAATQKFEGFFQQAADAAKAADSWSWMLITKRDRREPLLFMPFHRRLPRPDLKYFRLWVPLGKDWETLVGYPLSEFYKFDPGRFQTLHMELYSAGGLGSY